jgi:DNA topoisomerase-1
MEDELDKVESGKDDGTRLLSKFYEPLERDLKSAQEKTKALKKSLEKPTDETCDECKKGKMVIKWGRNGRFLACSEYPKCRNTRPIEEDEIKERQAQEDVIDIKCKVCGSPMLVKRWQQNKFLGCTRYPDCRGTLPYPIGVDCPEEGCKGYIAERYSQRGKVFYSCSEYPRCKFATWDKPVSHPCSTCNAPFMVERVSKSKGFHLRCLKCKSEELIAQEEVE